MKFRLSSRAARLAVFFGLVVLGGQAAAAEDAPEGVTLDLLPCLQVEENSVVNAKVAEDMPGSKIKLYFRRLHEVVEDFYWVEMEPKGSGRYWGVLPRPEDSELERREIRELLEEDRRRERLARYLESPGDEDYLTALWWRTKEVSDHRNPNGDLDDNEIAERAARGKTRQRHWMDRLTNEELEEFLEEQRFEPAEYFVTVEDAYGNEVARSPIEVVEVQDDCDSNLTSREVGLAENLTVGETAPWQKGEEVFHWLCEGVITRIDNTGVWRGDEICRACVIAWWKKKAFFLPLAGGGAATVGGVTVIEGREPRRASPSRP